MFSEQRLEETHEELQRVTEGESSLRNTCVSLEEQQKQKQDQIEVATSATAHLSDHSE